jgi:hypothetical protein
LSELTKIAKKQKILTIHTESWLRSWVQIPPGPFLTVRELRY